MRYLRNCWYVAATAEELGRSLLARTLLDERVVMYRKQDGTAVALEDRCSHRFYPLSKGDLKGDVIVCGYHGLEFDCTGACVRIPGQDHVPRGAQVRHYPTAIRWGLVWLWMGDPHLVDEALIPNVWHQDHPQWKTLFNPPIRVQGAYTLLGDNLLDPSHVAFLHKTTLGSDVAEIPHEMEAFERSVRVTRWTLDRPPAPIFARLGGFSGNVDRWQIITWTAPAMIEVDLGSCVTGTGAQEGDRSQGIEMRSYNFATPETADTFHYFWTHCRNYKHDDETVSKVTREQVLVALAEDIGAIEGVHEGMQRYRGKAPINTRADGAGLRAHRVLAGLIAAEAALESIPESTAASTAQTAPRVSVSS